MKPAVIMEMACTTYVCGQMLEILWPDPASRPYVVQETASGLSSAHREHFRTIAAANGGRMIQPVLAKRGVPAADVSQVVLIGFSAGCWGVAEMLSDPDASVVSAVVCIDGLHYPTAQLFEPAARRAASGEILMVDTYSAIPTSGYTSTRDSARKLVEIVGAQPTTSPVQGADEAWAVGNFWAMGFPGADKAAHVRQVQQVQPAVWEALLAPWLNGAGGPGFASLWTPGAPGPSRPPSDVAKAGSQANVSSAAAVGLLAAGAVAAFAADWTWDLTRRAVRRLRGR